MGTISRSIVSAGGVAATASAGDPLTVNAGVMILHRGTNTGTDYAIVANANSTVNLFGDVVAPSIIAVSGGGGVRFNIAATGSIYGGLAGITLSGSNNIVVNAGDVTGDQFEGVHLGGGGGNQLTNSGVIRSYQSSAVQINGTLLNTGLIESLGSSDIGVNMGGSMTNHGTILAPLQAVILQTGSLLNTNRIGDVNGAVGVQGTDGIQSVTNTGIIQGWSDALRLNGGNDAYNGMGGQAIGNIEGGIGNDTLLGGAQVDLIFGEADNDTLLGGGGADLLDGGDGNDTFILNAESSVENTLADLSGIDTVRSTITRSITWNFIENLILDGAANINGTGSNIGNSIVGNGGHNILAGLNGNDVLVGGGGNDLLYGQGDKDSLTGGAGNDRFVIQNVAHTAAGLGDVIVDLDDNGDDLIDFTGIIPGVLTFIGQQAFTAANQVRYEQAGANVLVQINTAGPNTAEGELTLLATTIGNGATGQVNSADFLL